MHLVQFQLVHTRDVTYVYILTEEVTTRPVSRAPRIMAKWHNGRVLCVYTDPLTGDELFPGRHFDDACPFHQGYALVCHNGRYYHIDVRGKAAYPWRFSDVGPLRRNGLVVVQHPRALGWSLFHVPTGKFITNPPRYRR
jgi:hypothetical protein